MTAVNTLSVRMQYDVLCQHTGEGEKGEVPQDENMCLDRYGGQLFHFIGAILHIPPGNYTHYQMSYSCIVEYFEKCRAALASLVIFTSIFCAGSSIVSVHILLQ